ncbi:MAG: cytochrome c5 family protein [Gammaproteobacteria bacterium]|nr:cytochrome c5 family protein [Gammaproteobacteria bacterium]
MKTAIGLIAAIGMMGIAVVQAADGQKIYQQACAMCHNAGTAGAPKTGDRDAWKDRIAQGVEILNEHAINGFKGSKGLMPAKGGRSNLSDDDVKAAVAYMVEQSG